MSLHPCQVELGVRSTSVLSRTSTKNIYLSVSLSVCLSQNSYNEKQLAYPYTSLMSGQYSSETTPD